MKEKVFPFYKQPDEKTCGATCLRMIAKYYGKTISGPALLQWSNTTREGVSLEGLSEAAERIGLRSLGLKINYEQLCKSVPLPCIAHWNQDHFVVIYRIRKNEVYIADPGHGLLSYTKEEFLQAWSSSGTEGVLLVLEPMPLFYEEEDGKTAGSSHFSNLRFFMPYLQAHRGSMIQILLGLMAGSLLQLMFPFLTQSVVDIGVQTKDIHFIYLVLLAQLLFFFGRTTIDIIRSYVLIHMSSRINIALISDFFVKLMKLPISYFDAKLTGDILQRIDDNQRIERLLTGASLNVLFSAFNFIVFSVVLAIYSLKIIAVFLAGTFLYYLWIYFFMKRRAELDYKRFNQGSQNQSKIMELILGMQEIKQHNAEQEKRWQLEKQQTKLFRISLKGLSLSTTQDAGSALINELKNILVTFLAAKLVIDGQISLGMMLSISYITGQLNTPVLEMVGVARQWQDARLSLERLSEVHQQADESSLNVYANATIPSQVSLSIRDLSFKYAGTGEQWVLKDLSLTIPASKVTAIVGSSGSGKTTFMKLLLRFYEPTQGGIFMDELPLRMIALRAWREQCGTVMQEGYIFSDTIERNIAIGQAEQIDPSRLRHAAEVANIHDFIEHLPMGYTTKIGQEGLGLSTGQKQRILIARAVYRNPDYLFFDEATSALDANNEKIIMDRLHRFFKGKTVVIIAHRLSTVKYADQIIVLDQGAIIEQGTHEVLTAQRGAYYELVKNQLELGN